jgi:probable HAF family extracellular repeat protein
MKINSSAVLKHVIGATILALCAWPVAARPRYSITDLGTLGGAYTTVEAINDAGQIVGASATSKKYDNGLAVAHAFLWQDGQMTDLGTLPGAFDSRAVDINNKGQVLVSTSSKPIKTPGSNTSMAAPLRAFVWQNGEKTLLTVNTTESLPISRYILKERPSSAEVEKDYFPFVQQLVGHINDEGQLADSKYSGFNNKGQRIGNRSTGDERLPNGFYANYSKANFYDGDKEVPLGTLGWRNTYAVGLNDKGQVVGCSYTAKRQDRAFLWQDGKMIKLAELPNLRSSCAVAINNGGDIAGQFQLTNRKSCAALWLSGKLYDLNTLIPPHSSWTLKSVADMNEKGQIAGQGEINGRSRAFLLTPIPARTLKP